MENKKKLFTDVVDFGSKNVSTSDYYPWANGQHDKSLLQYNSREWFKKDLNQQSQTKRKQ